MAAPTSLGRNRRPLWAAAILGVVTVCGAGWCSAHNRTRTRCRSRSTDELSGNVAEILAGRNHVAFAWSLRENMAQDKFDIFVK